MFDFLKDKTTDESKSKDVAKERLQNILMKERTNISNDKLEMVKKDVLSVVKREKRRKRPHFAYGNKRIIKSPINYIIGLFYV